MNIKSFQALVPKSELVNSPSAFVSKVKKDFTGFLQNGFYIQSKKKAVYVYVISVNEKKYTGLLCLTNINDIIEDRVLRHENTLAAKEQEVMHTLIQRQALIKPIMLTYRRDEVIENWMINEVKEKKSIAHFELEDGTTHQLYAIENHLKIKEIKEFFQHKIAISVIADGHHRSASLRKIYDFDPTTSKLKVDWFSTVYLSDSSLDILAFNRIIQMNEDFSTELFIVKLSKFATIHHILKAKKPNKKHTLTMYLNGRWYRIKWKKKYLNATKSETDLVDAQLFNDIILHRILNIEDVRSDPRIKYVPGTKEISTIEEMSSFSQKKIAFCLYPLQIAEFMLAAKQEHMLPPKSSYFLPRLINGFVVQNLNP